MDNNTGQNIILTGPPRSGTTLSCFLLNQLPNTIALHEPMNLGMFQSQEQGLEETQQFFAAMRQSLLTEGKALSKVKAGAIPSNPFGKAEQGKRASTVKKDWIHFDKPLQPDFTLIIKQNAHFTFLLEPLNLLYPLYTIIRNPVSTIASWNTIQAPVSKGNLTVLKGLRPALFEELECIPDLLDRQVRLLHELYLPYRLLRKDQIVRYEDIVESNGAVLNHLVPSASGIHHPLENKNRNAIYDDSIRSNIAERLLRFGGSYLDYYTEEQLV
ncbi:hypothetical protein [Phaeodactylibacter sp.]|uniref:hypothetical protein n=1 Tax=Phaeodactylibacter sp. TaxID=1940289 RepID=UPI0025F750F5|nr:hypothetical protein [Phaeodactylibacter sp.]MCI4648059.1 sulfotransferase [Phaeodactylibacter sp.]MCI5092356.1 sulfotransferase [Phaeodactylibacter sp.]